MSGHWGILVSDPWLQNQFTQVELRSLKSQVSSSGFVWFARRLIVFLKKPFWVFHVVFLEKLEFDVVSAIGVVGCVFFNGWCSSWAWGGRVEGLRLGTWLPRCQGWSLWERISVKKRELLIYRICIRTQMKRLILNCFSRWALSSHPFKHQLFKDTGSLYFFTHHPFSFLVVIYFPDLFWSSHLLNFNMRNEISVIWYFSLL